MRIDDLIGNPQRVPEPSRDDARRAKHAGSARDRSRLLLALPFAALLYAGCSSDNNGPTGGPVMGALDMHCAATGPTIIGECMPRHRQREFLRFLKRIDKETLPYLDLHLIVDNYATHKTAAVKRWLKAHSRFHLHFTPTSSSWLNMVERFFAKITEKRIRRGTFKSVAELESAIMHYLQNHNANPEPFVWTKSAGDILRKVAGAKQALESVH